MRLDPRSVAPLSAAMSPKISASKRARGVAKLDRAISSAETEKRQAIIDACRRMNALGINQGTSGNISLRHGAGMLITPTSVPYDEMTAEQIVLMDMDGSSAPGQRPSSEWRFHLDILRSRKEVEAVVHAHP